MRRMREQSVPGSPSPSYREPGYEAMETVDWNPEAVQGLEDSVLNSPQTYFCFGENVSCLLLQNNNSFKGCYFQEVPIIG